MIFQLDNVVIMYGGLKMNVMEYILRPDMQITARMVFVIIQTILLRYIVLQINVHFNTVAGCETITFLNALLENLNSKH